MAGSSAQMLALPSTVVSTHCLQREGRGGFFAHWLFEKEDRVSDARHALHTRDRTW
jgi:hypothetical protein